MATSKGQFIKYLVILVSLWCSPGSTPAASIPSATSSETKWQRDQERGYLSSDARNHPQSRIKSTIGGLLQGHSSSSASSRPSSVSIKQDALKLLRSAAQALPLQQQLQQPQLTSARTVDEYRCAAHCSCSVIQVMDKSNEKRANLTQVRCESLQFTDLLSIDRQTHIIHISLPNKEEPSEEEEEAARKVSAARRQFRMPRLNQFNLLREIVIINLRFEICDSEVFKRGQKMRRLQLNHNKLSRISKACLKHLDKLVELNLDHNQLSELESALFNSLLSLRSLSIAHNQLTELAAHQFANLTNLISLNLVGNSFKSINLQLFEPMQSSLRLLLLAKNQIKSFIQAPILQSNPLNIIAVNGTAANRTNPGPAVKGLSPFVGVVFKNLIKLNVDENKFERIKLLQLHRFFNVKYLSIRQNNIATIRDKAFNGLKLIELNLAHNQLQTVWKCAFCNATIKRLVLSHNNISLPLPVNGGDTLAPLVPGSIAPRPLALNGSELIISGSQLPEPMAQQSAASAEGQAGLMTNTPAQQAVSSSNMLILSQSIFGPLFNQLEYLDLSNNPLLADQLELLLEPLLKLEYLNLAAVGLDRYLPSPSLFKNLRHLRYLNLSNNQLDQMLAETVEPMTMLEVLDLSHNRFSELEESFLVTVDEMATLKVMNLASNPWHCSQCKVAPLYDWILRSPLYNMTCIGPSLEERGSTEPPGEEPDELASASDNEAPTPQVGGLSNRRIARGPQHYSLLVGGDLDEKLEPPMDMDLVLGNSLEDETSGHYNLLASDHLYNGHLATQLRDLASTEDDPSIGATMLQVSQALQRHYQADEYCLKCEFPGELRSFNIHELQASDFKFCAGAAPRFAASEPKIGLTLAIVIIGALFLIIIIVIVMYRKKSNTYYTNEDMDQLDGGTGAQGGKKPVFSISSDAEHQYGDNTDYSSPPMSQSFDSYSQDEEEDHDDEELDEEDEEELDEDLGEEEEDEEELDEEGDEVEGIDEEVAVKEIAPAAHEPTPVDHTSNKVSKAHKSTGEHHVGYASDLEAKKTPLSASDQQAQEMAKRMAAAEAERRHQLAEYQKNEQSLQRTSQSQGSSLSPADRSASGPIFHQSSLQREPAKRQASAHHHNHHHHHHHSSAKTRPVAAAAVAVAATEKLAYPTREGGASSNAPSLAPSAAHSSSKGLSADSSSGSRAAARTHPTVARTASGSQSMHSNSMELARIRVASSSSKSNHHRATTHEEPLVVNKPTHQQQQQHRAENTPAGSRQHSQEMENNHHQQSQDRRKVAMKTAQTNEHRSKLKPQGSSGHQQQIPAPSAGGTTRPPLVEQPSLDPVAVPPLREKGHQYHQQAAHVSSGGSRSGRQRFAVSSKEQRSQPATEWAHLRPGVEPLAAPPSLGVEHGSLAAEQTPPRDATHLATSSSVGQIPVARQVEEPPIRHQPAVERRRSPSASDATTADSLALEAMSYTASELEDAPEEVGGALAMDSSGSFGPEEFVNNNNNNNNVINESNNNTNNHHPPHQQQHHHHQGSNGGSRLQASSFRMRESHSNHSALTQTETSSREEL